MIKKLLREPLFHFLLIGASLFILYSFLNPSAEQSEGQVIIIEDSDVERLVKAYQQNWNALPDSATLTKLLEEEIKSEVFYREALQMQLDHNDEIIRRRLKQKYEFLVKDLANSQQPTDAELKAYYQQNTQRYAAPANLSFSQIYFSPDKHKNPLMEAQKVLAQIKDKPKDAIKFKDFGDNFHLQTYFSNRDFNDVRQLFGQDFSSTLFQNPQEGWSSPITSGYGVHLVYISAIEKESIKTLEEVKEKVIADWKIAQQQLYNNQLYQNLLKKYEVKYDLKS